MELIDQGPTVDVLIAHIVLEEGMSRLDPAVRLRGSHPTFPLLSTSGCDEAQDDRFWSGFERLPEPFILADSTPTIANRKPAPAT